MSRGGQREIVSLDSMTCMLKSMRKSRGASISMCERISIIQGPSRNVHFSVDALGSAHF